ncbi:MAG: choice-of-anchor D domain-containing protein [Oligoflexia bacterium]|nr:choice-of-anchor D domain-containing protein [Oligoflexia bacterium]
MILLHKCIFFIFCLSLIFLHLSCVPTKENLYDLEEGAVGTFLIEDSETQAFEDQLISTVKEKKFSVMALGKLPVSNISVSNFKKNSYFRFKTSKGSGQIKGSGQFPGEGGDCGSNMKNRDTCSFVLEFAPTLKGYYEETLTISYNNGVNEKVIYFTIKGYAGEVAKLDIAPSSHSLGISDIGTNKEKTFVIKNSGGLAANITSTKITNTKIATGEFSFKGGAYPGVGGTCTQIISKDSECTIVIELTPKSYGPLINGNIVISYNNQESEVEARTTISALIINPEAQLSVKEVTRTEYSFSGVLIGNNNRNTFTVINNGYKSATGLNITSEGGSFSVTSNSCSSTLAVSETCVFTVEFNPTQACKCVGRIYVNYNTSKRVTYYTFQLKGDGISPGEIAFYGTPLPYDFDIVAFSNSVSKAFSIKNVGEDSIFSVNLSVTPVSDNAGSALFISENYCGEKISPNNSCSFTIKYVPTVVPTETSSALDEALVCVSYYNRVEQKSYNFQVKGTGMKLGLLRVDATPLETIPINRTPEAIQEIVLTNFGFGPVKSTPIAALDSPYRVATYVTPSPEATICVKDDGQCCIDLLNNNDRCSLFVGVNSSETGRYSQKLTFNYYDGRESKYERSELSNLFWKISDLIFTLDPSSLESTPVATISLGTVSSGHTKYASVYVKNRGNFTAYFDLLDPTPFATGIEFTQSTPTSLLPQCSNPSKDGTTMEINGGEYCALNFQFSAPTAPVEGSGTFDDQISINYTDRSYPEVTPTPTTITLDISAVGKDVAYVELATPPITSINLGYLSANCAKNVNVTLVNTGQITATAMSVAVTPPSMSGSAIFQKQNDLCTSSLDSDDQCTLDIKFNLVGRLGVINGQRFYGNLSLIYYNSEVVVTAIPVIYGEAIRASWNTDPISSVDFGSSTVNTPTTKTLKITNTNRIDILNFTPSISGMLNPSIYSIVSNSCVGTGTISSLSLCNIGIQFLPEVIDQDYNAEIKLEAYGCPTPYLETRIEKTIALKGKGKIPSSYNMGWSGACSYTDNSTTITLNWNMMTPPSSDYQITSYNLYRSTLSGQNPLGAVPVAVVDVNSARTYTDSNVIKGTPYYYRVLPVIQSNIGGGEGVSNTTRPYEKMCKLPL